MHNPGKKISIVIPIYNEEKVIPELIKELARFAAKLPLYQCEFILVENGSHDLSLQLLDKYARRDTRLKIVQLSRNFGCDGGIVAGMSYATGDACVIMMADLQEPISLIKEFIATWEKGYDIVYGIVQKRQGKFLRNVASKFFYKLINLLAPTKFPENASDFRLIDKKVYQTINHMPEQNKYLRGLIMWTGFRHIGIPFDRKKRFAGESKADLKTVIYVALNGIFSFSYLPLRLVSYLGLVLTIVSFALGLFYLLLFFIHGRVAPGVVTIILITLFLFGVLFFILGIISEYIARIYEEVKQRPNFIVKKTVNINP
ncbi:MAG TPA: glycosyltransferase family 2 protein [Patescibacteria group bacterium]|nr:glycosyltransferase family 2 protein [Patescibacteria group bacterium]